MVRYSLQILLCCAFLASEAQPGISFTFDDGITTDMPGYSFQVWNEMLLDHLDSAGVKAVFFVTGLNKTDSKGKFLLESWNARGHRISNHTVSHLNYNSDKVTFEQFRNEFLGNDTLIRKYSNFLPLFRFPYLKEGNSKHKVDAFRRLMSDHHYKNGSVTIDNSDWYIDMRLRMRLKANVGADVAGFREYYLNHIYTCAKYYDELALKLTGRHIQHTLLLHHNLTSALFLGDLIRMFKEKGWQIVDAEQAFKDEIFQKQPSNVPAGESLIWALAKEAGTFEHILRYPAEDSRYLKDEMDKLGL